MNNLMLTFSYDTFPYLSFTMDTDYTEDINSKSVSTET